MGPSEFLHSLALGPRVMAASKSARQSRFAERCGQVQVRTKLGSWQHHESTCWVSAHPRSVAKSLGRRPRNSLVNQDYPLDRYSDFTQSLKVLRGVPHLRCRTKTMASILRLRSAMSAAMASFFEVRFRTVHRSVYNADREHQMEGFKRVEAPVITFSDCEGAGETFRLEAPRQPLAADVFPAPAYATVSAQLHLEALAAALTRVYAFTPVFRAERSQTSRHLSEFWMAEAEVSFAEGLDQIMDIVEGMVRHIAAEVEGPTSAAACDIRALRRPDSVGLTSDPSFQARWPRIDYSAAISLLNAEASHRRATASLNWGEALTADDERWLATTHFGGPIFVTHYPKHIKPFYMRTSSVGGPTVACFDLLAPGIGELAGGSLREERHDSLTKALQDKGMSTEDYQWYLDLRRFGTTPHGGFGLGWERLVSWISGIGHVRDCVAFPRHHSTASALQAIP